jgi:hypothetical protein
MRLKSLLLLGITSTLTFAGLCLNAGSATAASRFTLPEGYQGKVCVTGASKSNVSIKLGSWSTQFNGMAIREEGAFRMAGLVMPPPGSPAPVAVVGGVITGGLHGLSRADRFAARNSPHYNVEITARGQSSQLVVSDNSARARTGSCPGFPSYSVMRH